MNLHLPAHVCHCCDRALRLEWLVTNGLGGFASGTVAGALTRRYHGLLVAALRPPLGRTLLAARLDETVVCGRKKHHLHTSVWRDGSADPAGWQYLERFDLVLGVPTWTYGVDGRRLVKRIWMEPKHNVTCVRYDLAPGRERLKLAARLLVNQRDYHVLSSSTGRGFNVHAEGARLEARAAGAEVGLRAALVTDAPASWVVDHTWWRGYKLPAEAARGFEHLEDHLSAGIAQVELEPGGHVTFVLSSDDEVFAADEVSCERVRERAAMRLAAWERRWPDLEAHAPLGVRQLVLAADQFIVARPSEEEPDGHTISAGYPWFTDWGRDTMVALPGLTLVTGQFDVARQILRTWARYVERGLIPNRFPDHGDRPEYHTADATLWYLWAIDQYVRATGDRATLETLFPVMEEIVAWHRRGTAHNIRIGDDGLMYAGEEGLNLTWMDAKVGDRVITPRIGKPVELSALWYDALCNMARLADLAGRPGDEYARLAAQTRHAFGRFWNEARGCCFDVLDGPDGNDARVRPNQIFAVSLAHSPLARRPQEGVVHACEQKLLTCFGLRTLAPDEAGYRGRYAGGLAERDEAYHQGTAWGWLLGPFVLAHFRLHHDVVRARQLLAPLLGNVFTHGLGSLSEIFQPEEPFAPDGCPAQAWSVAEALRAWHVTQAGQTRTASGIVT